MGRNRLFTAVAISTLLLLGACGDDAADTTGSTAEEPDAAISSSIDLEQVTIAEQLAQIRGHHRVALELFEADDVKGAAVHAAHPIEELLAALSNELDEHGGDTATLEEKLEAVRTIVAENGSPEDLSAAIDAAHEETLVAVDVLIDDPEDPAFVGSTVAQLLGTVAHEYEEAVGDGGIELLPEYQDGYAFLLEAQALYEPLEADIEADEPEEAEEIEEAFGVLANAFPSAQPPDDLASEEDVEVAASLIGHELEETVGAEIATESDPAEIVERIEELLDEISEEYAAGGPDAAAELSAEAYLENYEVIEADVIELAPEVNEELEPLLGAELRRQIDEGAPQEEIDSMIARAKELLQEVLVVLEEGS